MANIMYHWKVPDTIPLDKCNIGHNYKLPIQIEILILFKFGILETQSFEEITESRFTVTENINNYINQEGEVQYKFKRNQFKVIHIQDFQKCV